MQPPKRAFKRSGILLCLLFSFLATHAQKAVHFENIGFEEAVDKAKAQKKIVFIDVRGLNTNSYTDEVDKKIFTLDSVADFMNAHCINIRMNMGTEEGKAFAPHLAMLMYPVYVFHGSNGDQLDFTNAGSIIKDPGVLLQKARSSLAINKVKNANKRSITFVKDSWANLLKKAKAANKLIFIDAYTTWCRPCIMMARDIFTLDRVADYYNSNFINVSMDMEKGDGPQLRKLYGVSAYPSYLYIDGDGKLVHQDGGYQEADKFLQNGKTALDNKAAGKFYKADTSKKQPAVIPFADATAMTPAPSSPARIRPAGSAIQSSARIALPSDTTARATADASPLPPADSSIQFTVGSWSDIAALARKTGKLIFVDANTSWCGPCKQMRKQIFPLKDVRDLYNRNFINVDLDMEKGEGIAFRKTYGVKAYPTFLYIDGNGEVVHKTVGSSSSDVFIQHALDAMSPHRNLRYLQTEYQKHLQDGSFVASYLQALQDAYENGKADTIALAYLQQQEPAAWQQPANWALIQEYINDATSPVFIDLVARQADYAKLYGEKVVDGKIYQTYMAWPQHYLSYPAPGSGGKTQLDDQGFQVFLTQVQQGQYAKKAEIAARSQLTIYFGLKDWTSYAATVNKMLTEKIIAQPLDVQGAESLFICADYINRFGSDNKPALSEAAGWAKLFTSPSISGVRGDDKVSYLDLYATLLEKTGRNDEAVQVRKTIDQQQLTNAKANAPFQTMRIIPHQP